MSAESIKEGVTLKSLHSRLEKEKAELDVISKQFRELRDKQKQHQGRITAIKKQMDELTKDNLVLSEHAKIRYLERVELIPVEEVESRVVTEELIRIWKVLGDGGSYPIGIGEHTCTIKNGVITSII